DETGEVTQKYTVFGLPTSIFIGRDGKVVRIHSGPMTEGMVQQFIAEIL
ncbi:MAG: hypothetical protein HYZ68_02640, partial [Chloroflexi bacterium]|nr:hypothetical protein [Chloroflexota bacterium]